MPQLNPATISGIAVLLNIFIQALKGLLPEAAKPWIPVALLFIGAACGVGLAAYGGAELLAGALEGIFAGATAAGLYNVEKVIPVAKSVFNEKGWIAPSSAP